jgi:hypothetical protein
VTTTAVPDATADVPRRRNRLGIAGSVLVLVAFVIPLIVLVVAIILIASDPNPPTGDNIGWAGIGALLFMFIAAALAAPLAVIGGVLGIVSLFAKNRGKVFGVLAIVLGLPYGIIFSLGIPAALSFAGLD